MAREISDREFAIVQDLLDRLSDQMVETGVSLTVEHDFEEFARLRKMVGDGGCYPSVDPRYSRLDRDAFWLRAVDRNDRLIAFNAERIYRTDDFMALMRSERLWFDRGPRAVSPEYRLIEAALETFGGVVGHGCGMWVHPSVRRHGISAFLPAYQRAIAIRNYAIDWQTCLAFADLAKHIRTAYGYTRVERVIDGYFPVTGKPAEVYLGRISRDEILGMLTGSRVRVTPVDRPAAAVAAS
jgi:hypothetical protein